MSTTIEVQSQFNGRVYGQLALEYCGKRLPLQILRSNAGFYIGTADDDGPVSRESAEYYVTRDAAQRAHALGDWTQRLYP